MMTTWNYPGNLHAEIYVRPLLVFRPFLWFFTWLYP